MDSQTDRSDLRALLDLAEKIQGRIESAERINLYARVLEGIFVGGGLTAAGFGTFSNLDEGTRLVLLAAAILIPLVYVAWLELTLMVRNRKRLLRDIQALARVLDIAQDSANSVMRNASPLERAEMAVRLSQFNMPPYSASSRGKPPD